MIDLNIVLGTFRVKEVITLTNETFILRTDRNSINFTPGQRVSINMRNDRVKRSYSIYSGKADQWLEFLIREVPDGYLTPKLKPIKPGDELEIFGPNGHFTLKQVNLESDRLLFVSTGTGIAPFHSMVKSHPTLNYRLLHGIRYSDEAYGYSEYDQMNLTICTSQEKGAGFHGRVTDYLQQTDLSGFDHIFLCGNSQMINDVINLSLTKGIARENIHTEIYF